MKRLVLLLAVIACMAIFSVDCLMAQSVAINTDGLAAHSSAILDIKSITKGMLPPRMTTLQRTNIPTPAAGLLVFDTDTNSFWFYNGTAWNVLSSGSSTNYWTLNASDIFSNTAGNVGIGTAAPLTKLSVQTTTGNYGITHSDGTVTLGTYIGNGKGWLGTKSNHPLTFFTNNSNELMTLLPNGNFGIGTTVPGTKLTIHTPNNTDGFSHESDGGIILKEAVGGVSAAIGTFSPHAFRLVANSNAAINIDINGNVGVGVGDQAFKMDIADRIRIRSSSVSSTAGISLNNADNSAVNAFIGTKDFNLVGIYGDVAGWGLLMNTNTGNVGIGAATPVNRLQIGAANGFNGNDITFGNGVQVTAIAQTNTSSQFASTTDFVFLPKYGTGGRIGINTSTPQAALDVVGTVATVSSYSYINRGGYLNGVGDCNFCTANVSIHATGAVHAGEFDAFSDARIKNIIGISNKAEDLETISTLKVTDYTMKDKVMYGNKTFKKVIAQEVEKVYPQAVSKHTDFIPNVYQHTNKIEKTTMGFLLSFTDKHNISHNAKKLRVLLSDGETMQDAEIVSIPSDTKVIISVPFIKSDNIFVYGEEVDDFRTVDYEGLTTLNISATQELSNLIKRQQTVIENQQQQIDLLLKRMEVIEKK
ncbi:tail fiber domain-containing protein [Ferruginibacter paludis]|uniref:tail fiber domain-containing protein n=1 Tax=Ferruginibacter paludis TaxID=1310417 RepID=UPI0025B33E29|nr:tail fiber domain-containing protein [Ferruginibacter paludis]MDN3659491.1 tail fiber domain-containing protein [Ferruginibacter paludis]